MGIVMVCSMDGCDRRHKARGLCAAHYLRWRKYGDPTVNKRPNFGVKRNLVTNGYVRVYEPTHPLAQRDGYVLEHRKVLYDAGIELPPRHDVHHKNEDRQDNRVENLEVVAHAAHWRAHLKERGTVTNQYGTWPLKSA